MSLLLLAPVTVKVEPIERSQATDDLAREGTLRKSWGTAFTLRGQLDYGDRSTAEGEFIGGADRMHRATLTVDRYIAKDAGWQPREGDRVSEATDEDGDTDPVVFYVKRSIRRAYWFGGRPTTLVIDLVDRFPERAAEV